MRYLREHIDLAVLGGMGPRATHYFVEVLMRCVEEYCHPTKDQDYPNVLVRYACYLPDRTQSLETSLEPFAAALTNEIQTLLELGCPTIIVPCITAHAVIQSRFKQFPVVNIPFITAQYIQNKWPMARVGVLATRGTRLARVVDKFTDNGQNLVLLDLSAEERLMKFIYEKAKTWHAQKDLSGILEFADLLRKQGADLIVAGCTELEMCLACCGKQADLIFPLQIAAAEFVSNWMARRK